MFQDAPPEIRAIIEKIGPAKAAEIATPIKAVCEAILPILQNQDRKIAALENRLTELERKGVEYVGGWQKAADYRRGHMCTHGGSLWAACRNIEAGEAAPGVSTAWQLCARAGKDGKDGRR